MSQLYRMMCKRRLLKEKKEIGKLLKFFFIHFSNNNFSTLSIFKKTEASCNYQVSLVPYQKGVPQLLLGGKKRKANQGRKRKDSFI